jgi:hypothetical protein
MRISTAAWQAPIRVFGLVALLVPTMVLAFWPLLLHLLRTSPSLEIPLESANTV